MEITRFDGTVKKKILTGMIVSTEALAQIVPLWKRESFATKSENLIASWCVDFYSKHQEAPKKNIEDIASAWAETNQDKATITLISTILDGLSSDYEKEKIEIIPSHIVDLAKTHFNEVKLGKAAEEIQILYANREFVKLEEKIINFSPSETNISPIIPIFQDLKAISDCCGYMKTPPLITYPEGLGDFFEDSLKEDNFVAFMGPDKSGKSYWLLDVAFRACYQRNKVMYFEAGDLTQNQVMSRFMVRVSERPAFPKIIDYPTDILEGNPCRVVLERREYLGELTFKKAARACRKAIDERIKSNEEYFKLKCYSNSTLKVSEIRSVLEGQKRVGWIPKVVVIDYADILCPPTVHDSARDQVNEIWEELRALSQDYHCLVVTATQANAKSYSAETLDRRHFSEDKRKNANVTGMIGISSTNAEKEQGLCRLNWVVRREKAYSDSKCCHVAGCLDVANIAIRSLF